MWTQKYFFFHNRHKHVPGYPVQILSVQAESQQQISLAVT